MNVFDMKEFVSAVIKEEVWHMGTISLENAKKLGVSDWN